MKIENRGGHPIRLDFFEFDALIITALKEDIPFGDITTDNLIDNQALSGAVFVAKQAGVIAGLDISERVFSLLDGRISFNRLVSDGEKVQKGDMIAEIKGNTRALLKGERTALNFLQHLSGIATKTYELCNIVKDFPVKIVDTRKTTAGHRLLEKNAVRAGGGSNHRFCLSDGVLIKDNHIKAAGGIKKAVELARMRIPHTIKIEVETESMAQVEEAVMAGAEIIMLDNMGIEEMKKAVKLINKRAIVEASGNVTSDRVLEIAKTGVDIISVGGLTHSIMAFDISMKFL
jgi:nicotinate-nucleotide pyrophosphorylase (carboxylating)